MSDGSWNGSWILGREMERFGPMEEEERGERGGAGGLPEFGIVRCWAGLGALRVESVTVVVVQLCVSLFLCRGLMIRYVVFDKGLKSGEGTRESFPGFFLLIVGFKFTPRRVGGVRSLGKM